MKIRRTKLDGFLELTPEPYIDERGFFVRLYDEQVFRELGLRTIWVQESHSHSIKGGIVRGLHIQFPPYTEGKLIRAIRGSALWVAVDLRKGSPTFGQWDSILLSDELKNSMYVEPGFANGHVSLTPCDLVIKASSYYAPGHDTGICWNDPDLRIDWKLGDLVPFLRERDKSYPTFKEFKETYGAIDVNELQ